MNEEQAERLIKTIEQTNVSARNFFSLHRIGL